MKYIAIFIVNIYRNLLSNMKLQQSCRFYPTCSDYAVQSLRKYGFIKGAFFSVIRILKCNPLSSGGYDPVK